MFGRSLLTVSLVIGVLAIPATAGAGANPDFTVPLHAMSGFGGTCHDYLPVDCVAHLPDVNVAPGVTTVFVFVANHTEIAGLATAFEWDPSWTHLFNNFVCQVGQLSLVNPVNPGGSVAGGLITAWVCITDPRLTVAGHMVFSDVRTGCLRQVTPVANPGGLTALDCALLEDGIDPDDPIQRLRLGSICVNDGGHDACDPLATPVESATWGRIKDGYR